jgi:cellulose biosynthesis protein BcsQ
METYKFKDTKDAIINSVSKIDGFEKCFVVRNIFSRFAIYLEGINDINRFKEAINTQIQWIDTIQKIDKQEDSFIYADLEKNSSLAVKDSNIFFSERHVENTNWYIKEQFDLKTPVTSFYSFKGGVGRTTATVLTALLLARQGKRVLIIDFDLEAPGLSSIFANEDDRTQNLLTVKGFVDFLIDYEANERNIDKISLDEYYFIKNEQILVGTNGGELIIVPAIATDSSSADSYITKLSKANIKYGFGKEYIPDLFLKAMEEKTQPDIILIDTRTGINDIGGLVFNRYAQSIFLIFYGNQQNMFGLESMLPELKELNERNVNFYLINSPVPTQPTDRETEVNYYVERSYEIFSEHFYEKGRVPSFSDESADHYPINIPYNSQASLLNNYRKLDSLINNINNPYQEIANIILSNTEGITPLLSAEEVASEHNLLESIIKIDPGAGTSEVEFKEEEDLRRYFYPRKDYKYIFDKTKFLIFGEKGVGKTALFSVLSHRNYTKALASFCGVDTQEIEKTEWLIGFERDNPNFPPKENFEALREFKMSEFRNYWMILLLKQIDNDLLENNEFLEEIKSVSTREIKNIATRTDVGEELHELLTEVNSHLRNQNKTLTVVYDHLDAVLPVEDGIRGKLVSALLTFYYDNSARFSNIKAKIFLRTDIFNREVNHITDKVKIQNYAVTIDWNYNQLLNIIWKRIYEQNKDIYLFNNFRFEQHPVLGSIPNISNEEEHKQLLNIIFGKRMGGNNKAYPYNWVKSHIEDTNNQIHPRTLIKLFSESAKLQKIDNETLKDRIIRSKNIETALEDKVSKQQVAELSEEYPELRPIFDDLSEKVGGRSPMKEQDLLDGLQEMGVEPIESIKKLKEIGLMKDYKFSKDKTNGYRIPDLYLSGLGFLRKGPK